MPVYVCEKNACYLTDSYVVSWLLKTRCIVIAVSNDDANLVQNHCANQLVCALNLDHNRLNIQGRLKDRKTRQKHKQEIKNGLKTQARKKIEE